MMQLMLRLSVKRFVPHMQFVPVKDESQQAMQCLHRTRQGFIEEKTARIIVFEG